MQGRIAQCLQVPRNPRMVSAFEPGAKGTGSAPGYTCESRLRLPPSTSAAVTDGLRARRDRFDWAVRASNRDASTSGLAARDRRLFC